jgi:hypothetical protein
MARAKAISITVTGNTAPLRKSLRAADKELSAFGKAQAKWAQGSALAYGIIGSAAFQMSRDLVRSASDLQEAQSKSSVVFGQSADAITKWSETASTAFGQSTQQALEAAGTFGNLLKAFGAADAEAGQMSKRLVELASDLASFNNTSIDDVLTALRSGLSGETEPLKRFGVALNDVRLKEEALRLGLVTTTKETLPAGIKAQAAYSLILKDTALAQGDFARTSDGLANQTRTLTAEFENLKAELGQELLPAAQAAAGALTDMLQTLREEGAVGTVGKGIEGLTDKLTDLTVQALGGPSGGNPWTEYQDQLKATAANLSETTNRTGESAAAFRILDAQLSDTTRSLSNMNDELAKAYSSSKIKNFFSPYFQNLKKQREAQEEAAEAAMEAGKEEAETQKENRRQYRETAKTLRETLGEALKDSRDKLKDAQQAAQDFGDAFAYSFGVSLAGAYDTATSAEENYQDALKDRKSAYDALDIAKQGTDLEAYLKAVQDVAAAEKAVTDTQAKRKSPAAAFQEQIAAAKTFGANLKTLIGDPFNLGQAGLQQLLDLGPAAGAQVTSDLIAGTAGFSVSDLNTSLADLASVQAGLSAGITGALGGGLTGAVSAAQSQVDALSGASIAAPGYGQGMQIVVQTGVGDPVAIGGEVKKVLQSYDKRAGKLTVQGPKKKAKKK